MNKNRNGIVGWHTLYASLSFVACFKSRSSPSDLGSEGKHLKFPLPHALWTSIIEFICNNKIGKMQGILVTCDREIVLYYLVLSTRSTTIKKRSFEGTVLVFTIGVLVQELPKCEIQLSLLHCNLGTMMRAGDSRRQGLKLCLTVEILD